MGVSGCEYRRFSHNFSLLCSSTPSARNWPCRGVIEKKASMFNKQFDTVPVLCLVTAISMAIGLTIIISTVGVVIRYVIQLGVPDSKIYSCKIRRRSYKLIKLSQF